MEIENHLELLGLPCEDKITGLKGIVTSISFDLYGCIQVTLHPGLDNEGKPATQHWVDVTRLYITDKTPVMDRPNFKLGYVAEGRKGPNNKPRTSAT